MLEENTDEDDVAQKRGTHKKHRVFVFMKWSKGKMCHYCHRVHELKYAKFNRKQLKEHVDGKDQGLVRFKSVRDKCVEMCADDNVGRLTSLARWEPPTQAVQQTETVQSVVTKGEDILLGSLRESFPA